MNYPEITFATENSSTTRGTCLHFSSTGRTGCIALKVPSKGHTPSVSECNIDSVTVIGVGHLYAREAKSFAVNESLDILADVYVHSGVDGMRSAIGGGIFALIIIDKKRRHLYAMTDLLSCMPLFYRTTSAGILMGTNQFDLAEGLKPSLLACGEYLAFGYLPFHPSLFLEVQRIGPAQLLTMPLDGFGQSTVTEERYPMYPPIDQRITDEEKACERLDELFIRYFSRIGDEPIACGLSGGYDSRLIAAYCRDKQLQLVTFDTPQTNEARFAQHVATAIGHTTQVFQVPPDAPSLFVEDFYFGTGTMDSLESSHVFGNLHALTDKQPTYILDGFLGGEAMGSHYYYSLSGGTEPGWRVLLGLDSYKRPPQTSETYAARLATAYGRRIGHLPIDCSDALQRHVHLRLTAMAEGQRANCDTDADMLELLSYRIRTCRLIAGGPVTFLRRNPTLCPFYDTEIFTTCTAISKSMRAGDQLYNTFFRTRFPELACIAKESTGGWPAQRPVIYRMTHLKNAVERRIVKRLPVRLHRAGKDGGDFGTFQSRYFDNEPNRQFFRNTLDRSKDHYEDLGLTDLPDFDVSHVDSILHLRIISLLRLSIGTDIE